MQKKIYQQPKMEVVELNHTDIICTSFTPQNEEYEEVNESVTNSWFN